MNTQPTIQSVLAERLRRQALTRPCTDPADYRALFKRLQPVSPIANTRPGDPPSLVHRTIFPDAVEANAMRARREIVKGRFLGGTVGYVLAEDLENFANAFARPLPTLNRIQRDVFDVVRREGPLTPRQIKEETGLLSKYIGPALERLQEAFLVFEDQVDNDWERAYYEFASEWPNVDLATSNRQEATRMVILRFLEGHVFATLEQIRDWSGLPTQWLKPVLTNLEDRWAIVPASVAGLGEGWLRTEDTMLEDAPVLPGVFMLHKADALVRSHAAELKRRFGTQETLQYLLIDGVFAGAVVGHWRIGPHDVEDIVVELPSAERQERQAVILQAVGQVYHPPDSQIRRCFGQPVPLRPQAL